MKRYVVQRPLDDEIGDCRVMVVEGSQARPLRHVILHSPDGFEWGYGGSGPADLALSILADHFGEKPTKAELYEGKPRCWKLHQRFKWDIVANADRDGFAITTGLIDSWLAEQKEEDQD